MATAVFIMMVSVFIVVGATIDYCSTVIINARTVACLVTWPLNESEAGVDLALIETSLLFLC